LTGIDLFLPAAPRAPPRRRPALAGPDGVVDVELLTLGQLHDRLLPRGATPRVATQALGLPEHVLRGHGDHLDVEEILDGLADLRLRGPGVHLEGVLVLVVAQGHAALGHQRLLDHLL
jgi:hypothetical protein